MGILIDEIGNRYGRFIVLKKNNNFPGDSRARWECKCDCGKMTVISGKDLRQGKRVSCGCQKSEKARERGIERFKEYKGLNHPRWKNGSSMHWWKKKLLIDGAECELCGFDNLKALCLHHQIQVRNGGKNEEKNLQILCANCHQIIHKANIDKYISKLNITFEEAKQL